MIWQPECVEAVTLGLTRDATFAIMIGKTSCTILMDTAASHTCMSEQYYNQLMLPSLKQILCL